MPTVTRIIANTYRDSVALMQLSARLAESKGVEQVSVVMATPANLDLLREAGLLEQPVESRPSDMLALVRARSPEVANGVLDQIERALQAAPQAASAGRAEQMVPRSIGMARQSLPESNLALVAVPGEYAAAEAHKALDAGLNVMLFSDNVSVDDEVALKVKADQRGLLLMGPDCGTAIIDGVPLGFANAVRRGTIGCIGASGTGLQQVTTLIDQLGAGVSHAIGTGGRDLSQHVGARTMLAALRLLAADRGTRIIVLVGAGNNGRDAVVAGRRLAARGCKVEAWHGSRCPLTTQERLSLASEGIRLLRFDEDGFAPHLEAVIEASDYVIDGLLGVGSRGPMRPELARVAGVVNLARGRTRGRMVVAVDVPSGIDADDGSVPGTVVQADITVTFGAVKAGLLRFPAASQVGRLIPARIGLLPGHANSFPAQILDESRVRGFVPRRAADAHKYRVGRVLVVAGSDQYVGAAGLCSEAAARAGAGLVGLVSTEAVKRVLATRLPEATYPLTVDPEQRPDQAAADVAAFLPDQAALIVGPGIGRSAPTARFLRQLLMLNARQANPTPTVIDADALSLLAEWPRWWQRIGTGTVLTPHAGEMARLLGSTPILGKLEGEAPWETARRAAKAWGQTVVLKGPITSVSEADAPTWIYPRANAALATAGTGDVLAGLTAGLMAQGVRGSAAAQLAVVAHAQAARRVTARMGRLTLLASDLPAELPAVLASMAGDL